VNLREDAIYRIASMTKPIIAVAMLLLYEEGRWQLDDPVTKFIPEFADLQVLQDGKLVPLDRPMTMRHLMASSAGFAFGPAFGSTNPKVDEMYAKADLWSGTNDDIIPKLAKLPLEAQPGTLFRYGLQQEVQGAVLRRFSGEQLDTFLERRVFAPLGMKDTGFDVAPDQRDRIAPRYALDQNLKLILAPDQSPFPAVAGTPPRGEAEIPAVDRRALLNGTRLHAFCADAGQSRYARRRPDAVAIFGQADDEQPAPRRRAPALHSAVRGDWLWHERWHRARSIARKFQRRRERRGHFLLGRRAWHLVLG
jgi:CubicO group peptidase (beta-lactamase class C family)